RRLPAPSLAAAAAGQRRPGRGLAANGVGPGPAGAVARPPRGHRAGPDGDAAGQRRRGAGGAVQALGDLGPNAAPAAPDLVGLFRPRPEAPGPPWALAAAGEAAVAPLVQVLAVGDDPANTAAARVLGMIGPTALDALPALLLAHKDAPEGRPLREA